MSGRCWAHRPSGTTNAQTQRPYNQVPNDLRHEYPPFSAPALTVEKHGDGPIVDELHVHVGLELARFNCEILMCGVFAPGLRKSASRMRSRRGVERRSAAPPAIAAQRELRHDQQRAPRVADRQVHFSGGVVEDPKVANLAGDVFHVVLTVGLLDSGEDQESETDFTDAAFVDAHASG